MSADVIIIGAGIIGASIAYHLAQAGVAVTIVERGARPACAGSATWASAGGLRSQGRHGAEQALSRRAAARWPDLGRELDTDLEARFGGHLHLAETPAEADLLRSRLSADQAGGIAAEWLEGPDLRAIAPAITRAALAGVFTRHDGQAHPGRTAAAFIAAAQRAGATLHLSAVAEPVLQGDRVTGVRLADGTRLAAAKVVLAAGAPSLAMLEGIGIRLPLRWRALQMLLSEVTNLHLAPTVTAVGRNLSLKQGPSGQMMIGGRWFAPPAEGYAAIPLATLIRRQWAGAVAILPGLARLSLAQNWAGAEAQSIDGLPLIGALGPEGLFAALGFSGHGFQIAPAVGDLLARALCGTPEPELAPFGAERFEAFSAEDCEAFRHEPLMTG